MDDISLTVSLTGGHTHVVGGVSSDLSNTDLVLRIADVLDIDADEVLLLSDGIPLDTLSLYSQSTVRKSGLVDGSELTCVRQTLHPRAFRLISDPRQTGFEWAPLQKVVTGSKEDEALLQSTMLSYVSEYRRERLKVPLGGYPATPAMEREYSHTAFIKGAKLGKSSQRTWGDVLEHYSVDGVRSVAFAAAASEEREARFQSYVRDGPWICFGSKPRSAGDPEPDVRCGVGDNYVCGYQSGSRVNLYR